ncbi:MAG TPA: arsinothricin resistance N-acetyltransferase ArsN1 family B [Usitatibacter sp.]|nr:arsinothricin resistance N-acetyltransferase ArsN1 family B [Usitatibacter sp.]
MSLRLAASTDAGPIQAIYAPIVRDTFISFEVDPPAVAEIERRIGKTLAKHPWLVCEDGDGIAGYAYASEHRDRLAYQWSVDVSCYVHERARRRGIASRLYRALFRILERQGFTNAFAGIALPNEASVGMHASVGFVTVGTYVNVGFKSGEWRDVVWMQRRLATPAAMPSTPVPFPSLGARVLDEALAAG